MKSLTRIGIELLILWFALWFVAKNWVLPDQSAFGDAVLILWLMYLTIYGIGGIFYIALRFIFDTKQKTSTQLSLGILLSGLLGILSFLAFINSTGEGKQAAILFLIPLILLALRHLFLKLLAPKK